VNGISLILYYIVYVNIMGDTLDAYYFDRRTFISESKKISQRWDHRYIQFWCYCTYKGSADSFLYCVSHLNHFLAITIREQQEQQERDQTWELVRSIHDELQKKVQATALLGHYVEPLYVQKDCTEKRAKKDEALHDKTLSSTWKKLLAASNTPPSPYITRVQSGPTAQHNLNSIWRYLQRRTQVE
jgi:hypothetical protein